MTSPETARQPLSRAVTLALALALGVPGTHARSATLAVTSHADPGNATTCTLRQAIITSNHGAAAGSSEGNCRAGASGTFGSDTIGFDPGVFPTGGANTIVLSGARLTVSAEDLTIDASANGHVTIDADQASGVMIDDAGSGSRLSLGHLSLVNGLVTSTTVRAVRAVAACAFPTPT